jgi:hypothetical protein
LEIACGCQLNYHNIAPWDLKARLLEVPRDRTPTGWILLLDEDDYDVLYFRRMLEAGAIEGRGVKEIDLTFNVHVVTGQCQILPDASSSR